MTLLSAVDHDALTRAIAMMRQRDTAHRDQIDGKIRREGFPEAGKFAAYSCQTNTLGLQPWQTPPLWIDNIEAALREPPNDQRGIRDAAQVLQRMLNAGLSRYEPDPLRALERAEVPR